MPRRIPNQVTQTVSRLLEGGYLKRPPAWYNPTIQHPPAPERPRQATQRPDSDLPRSLQSTSAQAQRLREATSTRGRSSMNSRKKTHTQLPNLRAQPIVYDADRVRRQFFRDHPWEAKRPVTMVEMDYTLQEQPDPAIPHGAEPELHYWSRMNPSVEDVVQCTLRTHRDCRMSLAQAYQRTVAAYHAIQAERETRIRYANLEARSLGADLGLSQTDRGFTKEDRWLAEWAPEQTADLPIQVAGGAGPAARVKRDAPPYTGGRAYLDAAIKVSRGQAATGGGSEAASAPPMGSAAGGAEGSSDAQHADSSDFLGLGRSVP